MNQATLAAVGPHPARKPLVDMSKSSSAEYLDTQARFLTALANPNRLKILLLLRNEERTVGDLANRLGISYSLTSQHLSLLFSEEIVSKRRDWNHVFYRSRLCELDAGLSQLLLG